MKRWLVRSGLAAAALLGAALLLDWLCPPNMDRLATAGTEVLDRHGRVVALVPAPGGVWRFRVQAGEVAPILLETLVSAEDRYFWYHPGVNPLALLRASLQDIRAGRIVSGGSTLTMQAARLLEPRPRTVRSKVIEIARALQLEWHYTKPEILGIWLSLAPYGGNLEGVRAGSMAWFGTTPRNLDASQAALLAAIPRRPEAFRPDRHPDNARIPRDRILGADGGAMPSARLPMPRHAWQAVAGLAAPGTPTSGRLETTLDLPLQAALERLAADRLATSPERASVAMLVLDAGTREIRASVSGGDAGREARSGALDLTRAVRSPGSALKPFIYAMAFEDGIAGPETRLMDLPRHFGAYAPEDFDRGFAGNVTAGEALRRSLNLPAVALLEQIGPARFAARLKQAGVALRLPPGAAASLPLALGGAGISLRDLTGLYAALATTGTAKRPILYQPAVRLTYRTPLPRHGPDAPGHDEEGQGQSFGRLESRSGIPPLPEDGVFLQPRAAEAIASVLTQPLPESSLPGIAWKTGTSWGGRDAWAVGFDRAHVVGVWVGRPDGTPLPGATGRSLALPLLTRVFETLPAAPREPRVVARPSIASIASSNTVPANALRLLFPPPDATVNGDGPVTLRAMGGRRPLTFLMNGAPLSTDPARREVSWLPPAPGFYRLTVLDADGGVARVQMRVR